MLSLRTVALRHVVTQLVFGVNVLLSSGLQVTDSPPWFIKAAQSTYFFASSRNRSTIFADNRIFFCRDPDPLLIHFYLEFYLRLIF